jgi:hypothetical protein
MNSYISKSIHEMPIQVVSYLHQGTVELVNLNGIHLLVATNGCTTDLGVGKVVGNLPDEFVHTRNIANERAQYIPAVY